MWIVYEIIAGEPHKEIARYAKESDAEICVDSYDLSRAIYTQFKVV